MKLYRGVFAIFFVLLFSFHAFADEKADEYYKQGNELYNSGKFEEAVNAYTRAIARMPRTMPRAYLNCARAYNQLKKYDISALYYGYYLELAGDAKDKRKVKNELKAVEKKVTTPWSESVVQAKALQQLEQSMKSGPYFTEKGGGVLAYYQVLLRTGYATPRLATLQKQIADGLLKEALALVTPEKSQVMPGLDREAWKSIGDRIDAVAEFAEIKRDTEAENALRNLSAAWDHYYREQYGDAREAFDKVIRSSVKFPVAYWGRMLTSMKADNPAESAKHVQNARQVYGRSVDPIFFDLIDIKLSVDSGKSEEAVGKLEKMRR